MNPETRKLVLGLAQVALAAVVVVLQDRELRTAAVEVGRRARSRASSLAGPAALAPSPADVAAVYDRARSITQEADREGT